MKVKLCVYVAAGNQITSMEWSGTTILLLEIPTSLSVGCESSFDSLYRNPHKSVRSSEKEMEERRRSHVVDFETSLHLAFTFVTTPLHTSTLSSTLTRAQSQTRILLLFHHLFLPPDQENCHLHFLNLCLATLFSRKDSNVGPGDQGMGTAANMTMIRRTHIQNTGDRNHLLCSTWFLIICLDSVMQYHHICATFRMPGRRIHETLAVQSRRCISVPFSSYSILARPSDCRHVA